MISKLRSIDWDFTGTLSESRFSSIHWHPARFASQLPAALIGLLSQPADVILDPFMGSGTTLVEAQRLGRRSVGIDLNPVACLAARAKTLPIPEEKVRVVVERIKEEASLALARVARSAATQPLIPRMVQAKWYTRPVREDLGFLWRQIHQYRGVKRILAHAAFSAILLPVCRETRHWGYVCDNSTPKDNHGRDVMEEFSRTLDRLCGGYRERDADRMARPGKLEKPRILCGDMRQVLAQLPTGSIDLVVTSPPYFGVSDYMKSQRLSMEWFGVEIEPLRQLEIGARSKRHRSLAVEEYLAELEEAFRSVRRCLKPAAPCVAILGESSTRESVVRDAVRRLEASGFRKELDLNRRVSSLRRQAPSIIGEHLLVFSS